MKKYPKLWVEAWCESHGWTDLFIERYHYWAFPPGAVIPQPIPVKILEAIKKNKGLSPWERSFYGLCIGGTGLALLLSYWLQCPLPLVGAFTLSALSVAYLEDD